MPRVIVLKRLYIEPKGCQQSVCFDWRYVESQRADVLRKSIERAIFQCDCEEEDLKFFIREIETWAGYASPDRDREPNEPWHWKELSSREVPRAFVNKLIGM